MVRSLLNRILSPLSKIAGATPLAFSANQLGELTWLAVGQGVSLLLSLVAIKLTTSIGPSEYGRFILATSISGILTLAFFGPLEQGYVRYYFEYTAQGGARRAFVRSLLDVLLLASFVLVGCTLLALTLGPLIFDIDPVFYAAAALMVITAVITVPVTGMLNAMRLRKEVSLMQIAEKGFTILFLALFAYAWTLRASFVMIAISIASLLSLAMRLKIYSSALKAEPELPDQGAQRDLRRKIFRDISRYSVPFVLWGLLSWLQLNGERWVINDILTGADVGRYGLAIGLLNNSVILVYNILSQFLVPVIYKKFSEGGDSAREQGLGIIRIFGWVTFGLFMVAAVGLFFAGDLLIRLLSTKEFAIGGPVLFLLALGMGIFYTTQTMTSIGLALQRPQAYLRPKIIASALSIGAYIVGCLWAGIVGVAIAIVSINVVYFLITQRVNRRLLLQREFRGKTP